MGRSLVAIVVDAQRQAASLFSCELIFSCFDSSLHIISQKSNPESILQAMSWKGSHLCRVQALYSVF